MENSTDVIIIIIKEFIPTKCYRFRVLFTTLTTCFKQCPHQAKANAKAKIFFDVCRFVLWSLPTVPWSFSLSRSFSLGVGRTLVRMGYYTKVPNGIISNVNLWTVETLKHFQSTLPEKKNDRLFQLRRDVDPVVDAATIGAW